MLRTAAHTLPGAVGLLQPRGGYQKGGAQSAVIKNCLQYISTHLHEELRLEELAHECGLRSRSLSLKFKAEVGCGIPEYIHRDNPHGAYESQEGGEHHGLRRGFLPPVSERR